MATLLVYAPLRLSPPLAAAVLGLPRLGLELRLRSLAQLPLLASCGRRPASLRLERVQLCRRLATIGDALTAHESGTLRLAAGDEQGLRAERDDLVSRRRGIERALRQLPLGAPAASTCVFISEG